MNISESAKTFWCELLLAGCFTGILPLTLFMFFDTLFEMLTHAFMGW